MNRRSVKKCHVVRRDEIRNALSIHVRRLVNSVKLAINRQFQALFCIHYTAIFFILGRRSQVVH